jgi:pyruvate/2-oxoglutarate dehydrogenase complex dihydrolipoamide acyltransferase (E2) component
MTHIILDPQRWESVEAGDHALLEQWLVFEGDHVHAGQPLAQARLVHESVDITAPHDGMLEQIVVAAGETFAPGTVLARIVST